MSRAERRARGGWGRGCHAGRILRELRCALFLVVVFTLGIRAFAREGLHAIRRRIGRGLGRRLVVLALEERDPDHADVGRTTGAPRVRVTERGEVERGDVVEALAPSLHLQARPRRDDVSRLARIRRLPVHHVEAVDGDDREKVVAHAVVDDHLVLVAGTADHIGSALMPVHGQVAPGGAVVDRDVCPLADGLGCEARQSEGHCGYCLERFHSFLPRWRRDWRGQEMKRTGDGKGLKRRGGF